MSEHTLQHFWPGWAVSPGTNTTDQVRKDFMQTKMVTCKSEKVKGPSTRSKVASSGRFSDLTAG